MTGSPATDERHILIAGGGLSALRTCEALRKSGFSGQITVFSDEEEMPYNRPPLSKTALRDGPNMEALRFPQRESIQDVTWRLGAGIESTDLERNVVRLSTGEEVPFSGLVAATGVRARRLPVPGPERGRYIIRTSKDAALLHEMLSQGISVAIIGAGFIGCEVAATAHQLGCTVSVIAADPEAMIRPLGPDVGAAIRKRHEDLGISFYLGRGITRYAGTDTVTGIELADGTHVEADIVIEAVGSQCNTEWLNGNELDTTDGLLTDGSLRVPTTAPVVAVGDIARFPNHRFDSVPRRIEHWQLASETAKVAANTLLSAMSNAQPEVDAQSQPADISVIPYFWSDQGNLKIQSFGSPNLSNRIEILEGELDSDCAIGYFNSEKLVAVVLFGLNNRAVYYQRKVAEENQV